MYAASRLTEFFKNNDRLIMTRPEFTEWKSLQTYTYPTTSQATKFTSVFKETDVRTDYQLVENYVVPSISAHWGQLKLHINEVEFLALCLRVYPLDTIRAAKVVYAGSARGTHIICLSRMFPMFSFHLWDPSRYDNQLIKYGGEYPERIQIFNKLFDEKAAASYRMTKVFFISDVRRSAVSKEDSKVGALIDEDHQLQRMWVDTIQPLATMLKFNPPRPDHYDKPYEYYAGINTLQPFGPNKSTESRLIFFNPSIKPYDLDVYDKQFMHLNTRMRNLTLPIDEFNTVQWIENGVYKKAAASISFIEKYGDLTYDMWRFIQVWFIAFLTLQVRRINKNTVPLSINFDNPPAEILCSITTPNCMTLVTYFPRWLKHQLDDIEATLNKTFYSAFISRRFMTINTVEADLLE